MKLDDYQKKALKTDVFSKETTTHAYNPGYIAKVLGLSGEAGEVAEKYKKIIRDKEGIVSSEDKEELIKELGDVLWYTAVIAHYLGVSFEEVGQKNLDKLASRHKRGRITGKGDNR